MLHPRLLLRLALICSSLALSAPSAASTELLERFSPQAWQASRHYQDVRVITSGDGPERAYIFMPDAAQLKDLPLVFFHHGWLGMNPKNYGGLIDLMVRRGAVVIYPVYQDGDLTAPQSVTRNAAQANLRALQLLHQQFPGLVDPQRTLYWGFSMGASIALNIALEPASYGLPAPRALLMLAPGDARHVAKGERAASIIAPPERLPAGLPVFIASGASDHGIGVPTARSIAARLCHLPASQRMLLILPSDEDDERRILAGHGSVGSPDSRYDFPDTRKPVPSRIAGNDSFEASASLNLLDFYGYWRISMGLLEYADAGPYPENLFRPDSAENRFLGYWPSGKAYAEARSEQPCP